MTWAGNFDMPSWETSAALPSPKRTKPITYGTGAQSRPTAPQASAGTRQTIASLTAGIPNVAVCGLVLAKEEPKNIMSKKNPGSERYLLNFTIRDSPYDYINATCWGSKEHIHILARLFHIGDIIEISNPQVQSKQGDGRDEKYRPITPSPFNLTISETHTTVRLYEGDDIDNFNRLSNIPVKVSNDFFTLGDVLANGQNMSGETVSIMAGVRKVGVVKDIVCKNGRQASKCEVYLFDETCAGFLITLWDKELTAAAQNWIPEEHILFAADVRVSYDTYKKKMVASSTSQTILTVNPDTKEAYSLYQYAQTVDFSAGDYTFGTEDQAFDINKVKEVYSVEQLKRLCSGGGNDEKEVDYGIVYAYLSSFDFDGDNSKCVTARCNHCKRRIDLNTKICSNLECPNGGFGDGPQDFKLEFNILVSISDHTGTLAGCHLDTPYAEKILGCPVAEYMRLSTEKKTDLKWKLLLEKCKIYLKLFLPSLMRSKAMVRVMSLVIADPMEVARNIKGLEP